jgi:hypothetical protein
MSTLDKLKQEASEITQPNQTPATSAPASQEPTEQEKWRKLKPVMKYLQDHFTELAETLNVLEKDILVDFKLSDTVTIKKLKGQKYKITHPGEDKEKQFAFEFENVGENPAYCLQPEGPIAIAFKKILADNQIQCSTSPVQGKKSYKFSIKPQIKTKYIFTADLNKDSISLTIKNHNTIWSQVNSFTKNDITAKLMDELTHHVMREPNTYNEMIGNVISEETRTKLREKLNAEKSDQEKLAEQNQINEAKAQQKSAKESTLFGKLFKKK